MLPIVRELYKRLLFVGRDYPLGLPTVRERVKEGFLKNSHLTEERAILEAVHRGRWWEKEMIGVIKLKKYRAMAKRDRVPTAAATDGTTTTTTTTTASTGK